MPTAAFSHSSHSAKRSNAAAARAATTSALTHCVQAAAETAFVSLAPVVSVGVVNWNTQGVMNNRTAKTILAQSCQPDFWSIFRAMSLPPSPEHGRDRAHFSRHRDRRGNAAVQDLQPPCENRFERRHLTSRNFIPNR